MANKRLSTQEKLALVINDLKEKIASGDEKKETVAELLQSYPDLPSESTLRKWTKEVSGQTPTDYFKSQGVLLSHRELYTKLLTMMSRDDESGAKRKNRDEFRVEGDRLFIEGSEANELFLAELGIFDSVTIDGDEIIIRYPHQDNYYKVIDGKQMLINVEGVHEAVTDMWCSLLCFRGLYDYNNWDAKRQKVKVAYNDKGERILNGQVLPSYYRGIGDPTFDCRMLKVHKYGFKDSILRFAKYVEGFEREFDKWVEKVLQEKDKHYNYYGSFVLTHDYRPGYPDETNTWALYTFNMPDEYGAYFFPPYTRHSFYVEVLGDSLRLYFR